MNNTENGLTEQTDCKNGHKRKAAEIILSATGITLSVILLPILIINLILIVQSFGSDKAYIPNVCGYFPLIVQSGSMSGTIETDDLILVRTIGNAEALHEGDIVTFRSGASEGKLVTHRITEVTEDKDGRLAYRTKGDANPTEDTRLLYPEMAAGTYAGRIPGLGGTIMFLQTAPGILVCLALPLIIFFSYKCVVALTYHRRRAGAWSH